jgi:regulatory protein YycI of two-component signal transduction system YycFG
MTVEAILTRFGRTPSAKNKRSEFRDWINTAAPGEAYPYWCGDLASQRVSYRQLNGLASDVYQAYERGLVYLLQRKHGPNHYTYEARRAG